MARIRTIKPEFFTSEDIVSMTPLARLFYVSLWCESDREGRLEWKPNTFKLRYLPGDDCDVPALAEELTERGLILLYEVDGKKYAEIPTFKEHQVINNRESESHIPARVTDASGTRESGREGRKGKEGKGREGKEGDGSPAAPRATRKCPAAFDVTPELSAWATRECPDVDQHKATDRFRDHTFRNAISDWPGAWRNWMRKDQEDARNRRPAYGNKQADTIDGLTGGLASVKGGNRAITIA